MNLRKWITTPVAACFLVLPASSAQSAVPLPVAGDVDGDGAVTVVDAQLTIFTALGIPLPDANDANANGISDACDSWSESAYSSGYEVGWANESACEVTGPAESPPWVCTDLDADGGTDVADVLLLLRLAWDLPLNEELDSDQNSAPDSWEGAYASLIDAGVEGGAVAAQLGAASCASECSGSEMCCGGFCVPNGEAEWCDSGCDDGIGCTLDGCDQKTGKCFHKNKGSLCPESQWCVPGWGDPASGCVEEVWSYLCETGMPFCVNSHVVDWAGEYGPPAGTYLACPLEVARKSEICATTTSFGVASCTPAALGFVLSFDPGTLSIIGIFDFMCFEGVGCFEVAIVDANGSMALDTGHSVSMFEGGIATANSYGYSPVTLVNFGGAAAPLSDAFVAPTGEIAGNPRVFEFWFSGDGIYTADALAHVCYTNLLIVNTFAEYLPHDRRPDGVFVVGDVE